MRVVRYVSAFSRNKCGLIMNYEIRRIKRYYVQSSEQDSLILLHVVFRHGQRTPTTRYSYPTDPHRNLNYYPFGQGQLTNEGKLTEYKLGEFIRNRYDRYLGKYYTPGILDSWSTNFDRTKASLQLFLAGLYPPKDELVWNNELKWQPIPYNYVARPLDNVLQPCSFSPQYKYAYSKYQVTSGVLDKYNGVFKYLTKHAGKDFVFTRDVWKLMFTLKIQEELGLKLPTWTEKVWPKAVMEIAELEYVMSMATPELRNVASGKLLRKIINDTKNKIESKSEIKLHIYSAHEANIARTLICLNNFVPHVPDYGSCIIFEVHKRKNDFVVKVLYKKNSNKILQLLNIQGENYCPIDKFIDFILNNFK